MELANRIREIHKDTQRAYSCINYNHSANKAEQCSILVGKMPNAKMYFAECDLKKGAYCPFYVESK